MSSLSRRTVPAALAIAALGLGAATPGALARHGADDAAGHHRHSGERHHKHNAKHHQGRHHRHGADDGPNHR
jgi:hypothetical protein